MMNGSQPDLFADRTTRARSLLARCSPRHRKSLHKEVRYARKENPRARSEGEARRQVPEHSGRCVREGADRSRSPGQARREIGEAGHRDRAVRGAALGREDEAAEEEHHVRDDAQEGRAGYEGAHRTKKSPSTESKAKRSAVSTRVLKLESTKAASHKSLSRQFHAASSRRSAADRSATAKEGWATRRARAAATSKGSHTRHHASR